MNAMEVKIIDNWGYIGEIVNRGGEIIVDGGGGEVVGMEVMNARNCWYWRQWKWNW